MFFIQDLYVKAGKKYIVKGVSLKIRPGEIHAIMGPNGSGKSTLAYSLMGNPSYKITSPPNKKIKKISSSIIIDGKDITFLSPDERAREGLFLAFQTPVAIPGVTIAKFLRFLETSKKKNKKKNLSIKEVVSINKKINRIAKFLDIKKYLLNRFLHDNISGGEKKKIEMLQLLFLQPKYAVLDEIDTGLDVDALKVVSQAVSKIAREGTGIIIITHYQRILHYIKPHKVHVMIDGKIVETGDISLARLVEKHGYSKFMRQ